jgi:hypothetical protein
MPWCEAAREGIKELRAGNSPHAARSNCPAGCVVRWGCGSTS